MRELGVSVMWPKLKQDEWTTFRPPRKDRDWQVGEMVRIVFHPRGRDRKVLGTAQITGKSLRILMPGEIARQAGISPISHAEAQEDGFAGVAEMGQWMRERYGSESLYKPMNRLAIWWQERGEKHD